MSEVLGLLLTVVLAVFLLIGLLNLRNPFDDDDVPMSDKTRRRVKRGLGARYRDDDE